MCIAIKTFSFILFSKPLLFPCSSCRSFPICNEYIITFTVDKENLYCLKILFSPLLVLISFCDYCWKYLWHIVECGGGVLKKFCPNYIRYTIRVFMSLFALYIFLRSDTVFCIMVCCRRYNTVFRVNLFLWTVKMIAKMWMSF